MVAVPVAPAASSDASDGDRWYVPAGGDAERFKDPDGGPPRLHLIRYEDSDGERVLRLCEDSTGLLVGPTDRRLARVGIYVSNLRGASYHRTACKLGDFRPGQPVRLVREPDNEYDANAVAVTADEDGAAVAAYVNKQKARTLSRLLDAGEELAAISIRGTGSGKRCDHIAVLAATPDVLAHLLARRPKDLPPPLYLRR